MPSPSRTSLVLGFLCVYLVWGSTYLGIRVAVGSIPPFLMAAARFFIAGVFLLAILRGRGRPWPNGAQLRDAAIVGTFLLLGGNGAVAWAAQFTPSGLTALIIGAGPLFMVLTEWAWPGGQRPTVTTGIALALGLAGVAWLAAPWQQAGVADAPLMGVLAVLGGCLSWSIGSIFSRHTRSGADSFTAAALQMILGSFALAAVAALHGDFARFDLAAVTPASAWAFAYLTVFGSLVAFSTFVWLLKVSTPARVATHAYVNPVVALFLGWAILGESITPRMLVASALIIVAVVLITTQRNRPAP